MTMHWAVTVCLIAGSGALVQQVKESSAGPSRRAAPAEAKTAVDRGREAHNAGKRDEAVSLFERAVALDPTSSLYHVWLGHAYSRQLSNANFLRKPFIASSRRNVQSLQSRTSVSPVRGTSGTRRTALRRFLTLTAADPVRQSHAHYRLGMIKEKMGDVQTAATEYQAAIDLYPRHEPAAAALQKIQWR